MHAKGNSGRRVITTEPRGEWRRLVHIMKRPFSTRKRAGEAATGQSKKSKAKKSQSKKAQERTRERITAAEKRDI